MRRDRLACILVSEFDISCQARRLESEIDARLAAYSKIGDAITLATTSSASSAPEPSEAHAKAAEIEGLLQQLAEATEAMAARTSGAGHSEVKNHTLVRHQNILIEYTRVSTTDSRGDRDYLGIAWRQRLVFKPLMQNVGGLDSVAQV